jgi:putative DNA primase/helicase
MNDPFAPIAGPGKRTAAKLSGWSIVLPVPAGVLAPPSEHPKLGKPSAIWAYADAGGNVLGYVHRYDGVDGKEFRPVTLWRSAAGKLQWCWESWPVRRPLYGLRGLAERPAAPVVVTEGEKAADAATVLLPGFVVVTSPNGAKAATKADWSPLRGRQVTIWPDADAAGLDYSAVVAKELADIGAASVAAVSPAGIGQGRLGCRRRLGRWLGRSPRRCFHRNGDNTGSPGATRSAQATT